MKIKLELSLSSELHSLISQLNETIMKAFGSTPSTTLEVFEGGEPEETPKAKPSKASPVKETPASEEPQTPTMKRKAAIREEILKLGGTPPERGALSKYEAALKELKDGVESSEAAKEDENPKENEADETEADETEADETEADETDEPISIETFQGQLREYVLHYYKHHDDTEVAKATFAACRKKLNIKSITDCDSFEDLVALKDMLEARQDTKFEDFLAAE